MGESNSVISAHLELTAMPTASQHIYMTYLLRLWRTEETEPWRASLNDPHSGDKHNFASLDQMIDFLRAQAGEARLNVDSEVSSKPATGKLDESAASGGLPAG